MSKAPLLRKLRNQLRWLSRTPFHPQWLLAHSQLVQPLTQSAGPILDIGSADRWLASHLRVDAQYIALDYPVTATEMYGTRPDVYADAHRLPFADNCMAAVACFEVLEHVSEPQRVLNEISRILKPGGIAAVSMPFLYPTHDAPYDFQRWTLHGWERSARISELEIDHIQASNHSLHAAAAIACLALAAPVAQSKGLKFILLITALAPLVLFVNLSAAFVASIWPRWNGLTTSYQLVLRKRA